MAPQDEFTDLNTIVVTPRRPGVRQRFTGWIKAHTTPRSTPAETGFSLRARIVLGLSLVFLLVTLALIIVMFVLKFHPPARRPRPDNEAAPPFWGSWSSWTVGLANVTMAVGLLIGTLLPLPTSTHQRWHLAFRGILQMGSVLHLVLFIWLLVINPPDPEPYAPVNKTLNDQLHMLTWASSGLVGLALLGFMVLWFVDRRDGRRIAAAPP